MGHYVLNHVFKNLLETALVVAIGFALVGIGFERLRASRRMARRVGRRRRGTAADRAAVFGLLVPGHADQQQHHPGNRVRSGHVRPERRAPAGRIRERGAQAWEYRKLAPGPIEEIIFFDHPSGRTRIYSAMRWKAENLG